LLHNRTKSIYINDIINYIQNLLSEYSKINKCQGYNCLFYEYHLRCPGKFSKSQQKYLCNLCFV